MKSRISCLVILSLSFLCPSAMAQVPYTFHDGEPAIADEVNANFNELVQQIQDLQAQLDTLTSGGSASIVGTWDLIDLESSAFSAVGKGFDIDSGGSKSTLVFHSNGTFTLTGNGYNNELIVDNAISPACTADADSGIGCPDKSAITVYVNHGSPDASSASGTYTLSGSSLHMDYGEGTFNATVSEDRNTLIALDVGGGALTLTIGVKH